MKKLIFLSFVCCMVIACQKSINDHNIANSTTGADSLIEAGDTITYEIITDETRGWFGIWNEPDGTLSSNPLDSGTYGSPIYFSSGWRHTFICPSKPFQAFISAATILYDHDITANLYRNGILVKSVTNDAMKGVTKLLLTASTDTLTGTSARPVLTYEVLISNADTTKFEADAWTGQWNMPDGKVSTLNNSLLDLFAIPSGWKYTFQPDHLPFTMYLAGTPYTPGAATVTVNFYKNSEVVKTISSQDYTYNNEYVVQ